ncbi:hypothetical protein DSCW_29680 [Desulfosarcina widdelii]|uniref:Uncharacterized protein n=1 Tax=Desulfosarcina widdelii TaxID=947919 RepID=A0A5K7Z762_9BACT|nr:hypothetical protein [Desulfosarcina widdelii]BBO75551.1 hypothetical protein DSCW_29680 [Desulfosarcina widdelii]
MAAAKALDRKLLEQFEQIYEVVYEFRQGAADVDDNEIESIVDETVDAVRKMA